MLPNPQETADLITFTEEVLNEKLHFLCSDSDFIFIDDNFNPKGHFIELVDGKVSKIKSCGKGKGDGCYFLTY